VCTKECSTCQCCADGKYPKCSSRDNCNNGCIEGYYGGKCKHKCTSQNCLRCHRNYGYICLECTSGYYLYNHNCYDCGTQCKSCASNGCNSCYDGYWGNTCGKQCAQNCASCTKWNGYCMSCESGYYVYNGKCTTCGAHCEVCGPRGCTFCHDGNWGSSCDKKCAQNCASCRISDGYCLFCASGYYFHHGKCTTFEYVAQEDVLPVMTATGETHVMKTVRKTVLRVENQMDIVCPVIRDTTFIMAYVPLVVHTVQYVAKEGVHGAMTDTGETHVILNVLINVRRVANRMVIVCPVYQDGKTCNKRCVEFCSQCDRLNGDCHSCDIGRWGYQCITCGVQCLTCNQLIGCLKCNVGYYGKTCATYCGPYCQTCDISNNCTECLPEYYNLNHICEECQLKPNGCTCSSSVRCSGCIDGYFFNDHICSKCPDHCPTCKLLSLSSPSLCTSCASGMFGQSCQYRCSENCKNGFCEEENAVCRCSWKFKGETCEQCTNGRFGEKCEHQCSLGCESGNCMRETGFCSCKSGWSGRRCETCMNEYYGEYCNYNCDPHCISCVGRVDCQSCVPGKYGNGCQSTCPSGCLKDICDISDGSCDSCYHGNYGKHCNHSCPNLCYTCDQRGHCSACKPGFSNLRKTCTCRIDVCNNESECTSCNTPSFFVDNGVCCPCDISECVSCSRTNGAVICNICNDGFYHSKHGQCIKCNSNCIENACNSSSGKCLRGCKDGFWKESCGKECGPECLSCNQADGSCLQCKNNSKYDPYCNSDCKTTCNNSLCNINGDCMDGCVNNYFGNQCENRCDEHCISTAGSTICSERTGICLYGCELGYKGVFCPKGKTG
ncbi:TENX-like protein, partial [Mya arenaria]